MAVDKKYHISEKQIKRSTCKHFEGLFTQGSGYLHIRGSFEEGLNEAPQDESYMRLPANVTIEKPHHPLSKCGTYIPGITGQHPLLKEVIVNLPNPLFLTVESTNESLDMLDSDIRNYSRTLDLRRGILQRHFDWHSKDDFILGCSYERYLPRFEPHLILQKIKYTVQEGRPNLKISSGIDTNVKTSGYNHFQSIYKEAETNNVYVEIKTDNDDIVRMSTSIMTDSPKVFANDESENSVCSLTLNTGDEVSFLKITNFSTSRDAGGLKSREQLFQDLQGAMDSEPEILAAHERKWDLLWEQADIEIEGDEPAQKAVRFSIYHLLRALNEQDSRVAICAKGFAGEAYFGHYFWDTEIYLLPFYLYTQPDKAKNLVDFRINTLAGALDNARDYGYKGARYAWESGITGHEQCPNWQYADHEVHVTADIVFGLWHYYKATNDEQFLCGAWPVFRETARYWLERTSRDENGSVHIKGVMGPDEYVCFCDDNAYTNYMVQKALGYTLKVHAVMREKLAGDDPVNNLTGDELKDISYIMEKLVVHKTKKGLIWQCADFDRLDEPEFAKFWTDRSKPFGQFISQERNYRIKALKQADVLMLFYLYAREFGQEALESNYDYYFPYTTHDSSLSYIIHSILNCQARDIDTAYNLFSKALNIDLDTERSGAAEGIHIANCGGIWQAVVFGFAGMSKAYDTENPKPEFCPALPRHWQAIRFKTIYKGKNYAVEITRNGVKLYE